MINIQMSKKLTHKQFLENLLKFNKHYRNGEFVVLSKYKTGSTKVVIKNRYGYIRALPSEMMRGKGLYSTSSAIFKDYYFKEQLRCNNKYFNKGLFTIESSYIKTSLKILIKDKYGEMLSTPHDLLCGKRPTILKAVDKDSYYENKILDTNSSYRTGDFKRISKYKNSNSYIYFEDKYGKYKIIAKGLYGDYNITIRNAVDINTNITKRLLELGNENCEYNLINVKSVNNEKLKLNCKLHGVFYQYYYHHLNGSNCPKCGTERASIKLGISSSGWSATDWLKASKTSKNFESFKVYILKFTSEKETFYKIGRTFLTIEKRFLRASKYYTIEKVKIITNKNARFICELEQKLLSLHKEYKYIPENLKHGRQECFTTIIEEDKWEN